MKSRINISWTLPQDASRCQGPRPDPEGWQPSDNRVAGGGGNNGFGRGCFLVNKGPSELAPGLRAAARPAEFFFPETRRLGRPAPGRPSAVPGGPVCTGCWTVPCCHSGAKSTCPAAEGTGGAFPPRARTAPVFLLGKRPTPGRRPTAGDRPVCPSRWWGGAGLAEGQRGRCKMTGVARSTRPPPQGGGSLSEALD